jgi:arsenate reductase (thioredoxin)
VAHVLFVCLHNAGRSQMSQAFFEAFARGRHEAQSAGTEPAPRLHPEVDAVMKEAGFDVSGRKPRRLTNELAAWADVVVTMGCDDRCPVIPGKRYIDWDLPDPKGLPAPEVRRLRDQIRRRVQDLVHELDGQ